MQPECHSKPYAGSSGKTDYRITPPEPKNKLISTATYEEASLMIYDPRRDKSDALKSYLPGLFEQLRGDYP